MTITGWVSLTLLIGALIVALVALESRTFDSGDCERWAAKPLAERSLEACR
jgi:hypothetical protein